MLAVALGAGAFSPAVVPVMLVKPWVAVRMARKMEIDINQIMSAGIGGAAVWSAIKTEIKFLWRDIETLKEKASSLESG